MEWQPIETAPKDGSHILLGNETLSSVGSWLSDMDYGAEYEGQLGVAGWWCLDSNDCQPTHWMPKPDPPKGA